MSAGPRIGGIPRRSVDSRIGNVVKPEVIASVVDSELVGLGSEEFGGQGVGPMLVSTVTGPRLVGSEDVCTGVDSTSAVISCVWSERASEVIGV